MGDAGHSEGGFARLIGEGREAQGYGVFSPIAIMWVTWKEKNRRAFEGVEQDFVKL